MTDSGYRTTSAISLKLVSDGRLSLEILNGIDCGKKLTISNHPITIGSDSSADLIIQDPLVSSLQIKLIPDGAWWTAIDLESENGSFLNNSLMTIARIFPGDSLIIGSTQIRFDYFMGSIEKTVVKRSGEWVSIPRIVAHELRHYLEFLNIGVEHMRSDPEVSRRMETDIQNMEAANDQICELISILRNGCIPPSFQRIPIAVPLWEQVAMIECLAESARIKLKTHIPEEAIFVMADHSQIGRAIFNLAQNGLEACQPGDSLIISLIKDVHRARIVIQDTGCGMNSETMTSMWTPLFTTKKSGNGLGAFIARAIILRHNGDVEAESVPGEGSKITLTLPVTKG